MQLLTAPILDLSGFGDARAVRRPRKATAHLS
jgi:hypothetical protein